MLKEAEIIEQQMIARGKVGVSGASRSSSPNDYSAQWAEYYRWLKNQSLLIVLPCRVSHGYSQMITFSFLTPGTSRGDSYWSSITLGDMIKGHVRTCIFFWLSCYTVYFWRTFDFRRKFFRFFDFFPLNELKFKT